LMASFINEGAFEESIEQSLTPNRGGERNTRGN